MIEGVLRNLFVKASRLFKLVFLLSLLFLLISFPTLDSLFTYSSPIPLAGAEGGDDFYTPRIIDKDEENSFLNIVGETLIYRLSFLWFRRIAEAEFYFGENETPGRYYAVLDVEAKGFVGWITQHRRHTYRSEFELIDGGSQLRAVYHKRVISYGETEEVYESWMDYNSMRYNWRLLKNGLLEKNERSDIPEGKIFYDVLSAFYNFRQGVFGELEEGKNYRIDTVPTIKGVTHFDVRVATNEERIELQNNGEQDFYDTYLLMVDIPKEIFDSKTGDGRIWIGEGMLPVAGLIESVKGVGNVIGTLEEINFDQDTEVEEVGGG